MEGKSAQLANVHVEGVRGRAQGVQQVWRHAVRQASEGVEDGGWRLKRPLPCSKQASACSAIGVSHCKGRSFRGTRCSCCITTHSTRPPENEVLQKPPMTGEGTGTAMENARHARLGVPVCFVNPCQWR